ncbi:hypothetical protein [Gryllotalpicola protaetiae]|uniref:Uncharacterized protein n=1 Tax=Gryllotalpicola protaetiae TaxID=2419771 RepID=A0A387BWN7_9MICO|nr:hypothetical protein [Gryllotalpicola protaetiae]AYG02731.1 hypothetical protein D7I44_03805 [Gryllotalpicola protaetiae]
MIVGAALAVASVSYASSITLGLLVARRRVDSSAFHWLHHVLYIATFVLAAAAIAAGLWRVPPVGWILLPVVVPFALIPFVGTRGPQHPITGLVPAPFYIAAAVALLA